MGDNIHIKNIIENYKNMEKEIVNQLNYVTKHGGTVGTNREYIWKSFFERIIPKKFNIDRSVFVMDSFGNISNEVDLAIYDEQYTPYIFRYGTIKFIPIEAVAAVIECKSSGADEKHLSGWLESINKLNTGTNSIVRINGNINYGINLDDLNDEVSQTSTTPIKILCHMGVTEGYTEAFDITIEATKNSENQYNENLLIKFNGKYKNLFDWYKQLNHYVGENNQRKDSIETFVKNDIESSEKYDGLKHKALSNYEVNVGNTILSFIFQFNQLLMLINNPIFFPHIDYVNMFNNYNSSSSNQD